MRPCVLARNALVQACGEAYLKYLTKEDILFARDFSNLIDFAHILTGVRKRVRKGCSEI